MNEILIALLALTSFLIPASHIDSEEQTMEKLHTLSDTQQSIVLIAAFTAEGQTERLQPALRQALDAGLTVNEIKEVLVHLYAYTGFPRSLNALTAFKAVLDARKAEGIEDMQGREASPVPPDLDRDAYGAQIRAKLSGLDTIPPPAEWQLFSPIIDTFLKEHLFADLFVRDVISPETRELATVAALASMTGTEGQLYFHFGAAMQTGLTEAHMKDVISVLAAGVDSRIAERADSVLALVLNNRKQ